MASDGSLKAAGCRNAKSRRSRRAMSHRVTLIPGDGIGPEVTTATRRIIDATGVGIDWDVQIAGATVIAEYGEPLPEHVVDSIRTNGVALKGPVMTPVGG